MFKISFIIVSRNLQEGKVAQRTVWPHGAVPDFLMILGIKFYPPLLISHLPRITFHPIQMLFSF